MGGPLKVGPSGKHSNNRDSDQSLISVDGSETEEDDLFRSKWKSSIPAKKLSSDKSTSKVKGKMDVDLNSIEKTEVLTSTAAKDRISVKPKGRRSSRQSKKREPNTPQSLPSLNEESPSRSMSEETKSGPGSPMTDDDLSPTIAENKTVHVQTPSPAAPLESSASRPKMSSITISREPKSPESGKVASPVSSQKSPPSSPTSRQPESGSSSHSVNTKVSSNVTTPATAANEKNNETAPARETNSIKSRASIFNQNDSEVIGNISIKSRMSQFQGGRKSESPSLKVSDPESNVAVSPKEDYKAKRQNRSKTIPGASEDAGSEQSSPKVQRASSHRVQGSPTKSSPQTSAAEEKSSPVVKKLDTSRFGNISSSTSSSSSSSSQPAWMSKVKRRQDEEEEESKEESKEGSQDSSEEPVSSKFGGVGAKKSVFNQSGTLGRKKEVNESAGKTESGRRPSIEVTPAKKKESIEIDISELSSVKAMSSSYAQNPSKPGRENKVASASATSSMAERAKMFGKSSNQSTEVSDSSHVGNRVGTFRGGSVKTSPTKTQDVKASLPARVGSVKTHSVFGGSSSLLNKSDTNTNSLSSKSESKPLSSAASTPKLSTTNSSTVTPPASNPSTPASSSKPFSNNTSPFPTSSLRSVSRSPHTSSLSNISSVAPLGVTKSSNSVHFAGVKPLGVHSSPVASANVPTASASSSASVVSSSSSSSQPPPSSSSSSTSSPSSTGTNPRSVRAHASFSAATKPVTSQHSPSLASRPSFKSSPTKPATASSSPANNTEKSATGKVPAWRANLQKKDVQIEIIENKSSPTQSKTENLKKGSETSKVADASKTSEIQADKASHRSSKVLDMVKNFQNLQVTS